MRTLTSRLSPIPSVRRTTRPISYQRFLDLYGKGEHVEWVDGRVTPMAPVTGDHCECRSFLLCLLSVFAEERQPGRVFGDPFQMKTGPRLPGRQPDLFYVRADRLDRLRHMYFDGPADLVVEVISPGSRALDRAEKFEEYQLGGVREYLVVDPGNRRTEWFRLGPDGQYCAIPVDDDGRLRGTVLPDFFLRPIWLWKGGSLISAYKELGLL